MSINKIERRRAFRRKLDRRGVIRIKDASPIECWVENISPFGAMISLKDNVDIGEAFLLFIPEDNFRTICALRYRIGRACGAELISNHTAAMKLYGAVNVEAFNKGYESEKANKQSNLDLIRFRRNSRVASILGSRVPPGCFEKLCS